jgi:DNA-binding XRE family transcriptional regulator
MWHQVSSVKGMLLVFKPCIPWVDVILIKVYRSHMENVYTIRSARWVSKHAQRALAECLGITKTTVGPCGLGNELPSPRLATLLQQKFPRLDLNNIYTAATAAGIVI